MNKKKVIYTKEFKEDAVELASQKGVTKAAEELGINPANIRRWKQQKAPKDINDETSPEELRKRIEKLEKENGYLKKINEVLKKSTAIFSNDQIHRF